MQQADQEQDFKGSSFRGADVGLGKEDPCVVIAQKLQQQFPQHMILVQAGNFLHGFDATAHILSTMKQYKLQVVGTAADPHLRVGFPLANFKRRMHQIADEYQTPYIAAVGSKMNNYEIYQSPHVPGTSTLIDQVPAGIIAQVITDLQQRGELNKAAAKQVLANPDTSGFKLKSHAKDLDMQVTLDLISMPRDVRATFGENLRECMARIMVNVFAFGNSVVKEDVLHAISTDVDLLKHYIEQAQRLNKVKIAFTHRAGLAVELGRLVGGLIRANKVPA